MQTERCGGFGMLKGPAQQSCIDLCGAQAVLLSLISHPFPLSPCGSTAGSHVLPEAGRGKPCSRRGRGSGQHAGSGEFSWEKASCPLCQAARLSAAFQDLEGMMQWVLPLAKSQSSAAAWQLVGFC